jgi:hypothetical protein
MKIGIVSTFSKAGYDEYAKYFVDSLIKYLDPEVEVFLYLDDIELKLPPNIKIINFNKTVPELTAFRERNKDRMFNNFLKDACRFSFKSYAWCHAGLTKSVDLLIWLDADTELYNPVSKEYLISTVPSGYYTSHLYRKDNYTETGYLAWDLTNPYSDEFFKLYKEYYDTDSIYTLPFFTDCHVYDATKDRLVKEGKIAAYNLSPAGVDIRHFDQAFKGYILHYKGDRVSKRERMLSSAKRTMQ